MGQREETEISGESLKGNLVRETPIIGAWIGALRRNFVTVVMKSQNYFCDPAFVKILSLWLVNTGKMN